MFPCARDFFLKLETKIFVKNFCPLSADYIKAVATRIIFWTNQFILHEDPLRTFSPTKFKGPNQRFYMEYEKANLKNIRQTRF